MCLQHIFISLDLFLTTLQSSLIWTFWAHEADQLSGVLPDPVFYIFFSCASWIRVPRRGVGLGWRVLGAGKLRDWMVTLHSALGFDQQGNASKMLMILAHWCFCCQWVIQRAWRSGLLLNISDNYLSKDLSWCTFSEKGANNLAFETLFQLGDTKWCVDLLVTVCSVTFPVTDWSADVTL